MTRVRTKPSTIPLFPNDQELKDARKKLPFFKAHDLNTLINAGKANTKESVPQTPLSALRRRNYDQLKDLLKHLGIEPTQPDSWLRGFFMLAFYHHGVGHVAWSRPRSNRNSATWTPTHDLDLLQEVI